MDVVLAKDLVELLYQPPNVLLFRCWTRAYSLLSVIFFFRSNYIPLGVIIFYMPMHQLVLQGSKMFNSFSHEVVVNGGLRVIFVVSIIETSISSQRLNNNT